MIDDPITKKSLGQHWLHDDDSLVAMLEAADIGPDDTVLEIGPGPGTLTKYLVRTAKKVIAVEFDHELALALPKRVPNDNLTVIEQDILQFDFSQLPSGYKVVANIPYYLTSNLLRRLCEQPNHFSYVVLLVQKEVAERVCARPGDMGILSVGVQYYAKTSLDRVVPAELFTPPPKIDSQILKLVWRDIPLFPDVDTKRFFQVVKAGFSQRRKTLLNALSGGLQLDREATMKLLERAGVSSSTRAQALSLEDWYALYEAYIDR